MKRSLLAINGGLSLRALTTIALAAGSAAMLAPTALADISGFGDFSGFQINKVDIAGAPAVTPPTSITLTGQGAGESRSIFFKTKQDVAQFQVNFKYRLLNLNNNGFGSGAFGMAFVVHNSGFAEFATGSGGGGLGYTGISSRSIALGITNLFTAAHAYNGSTSDVYTGGAIGGTPPSTSPVNPGLSNPIAVTITYSGSLLSYSLTDTVTNATTGTRTTALGSLATIVNGSTAFVGFTASTSNDFADQIISDFSFSNTIPAPGTASGLTLAALLAARRRRAA